MTKLKLSGNMRTIPLVQGEAQVQSSTTGYAVVSKQDDDDNGLCFTDDCRDFTVWQVYVKREDAQEWVDYLGPEYEVVEVTITLKT